MSPQVIWLVSSLPIVILKGNDVGVLSIMHAKDVCTLKVSDGSSGRLPGLRKD